MKVFLASFAGHWLGGDAIVIDETKEIAFDKLKVKLEEQGIGRELTIDDLQELDVTVPQCIIIDDGNY